MRYSKSNYFSCSRFLENFFCFTQCSSSGEDIVYQNYIPIFYLMFFATSYCKRADDVFQAFRAVSDAGLMLGVFGFYQNIRF